MSGNPRVSPSDRQAVVGVIDPDANAAATYLTAAIDMSQWQSIQAIIMAGDLGSSATIDAKLTQATTSGGTYKDVTGKSITQLTQAGADDNKQAIINCRSEELDVANGYRYVKLSMTVGTATSDCGAIVLGTDARVQPGTDLTSVDEVVR